MAQQERGTEERLDVVEAALQVLERMGGAGGAGGARGGSYQMLLWKPACTCRAASQALLPACFCLDPCLPAPLLRATQGYHSMADRLALIPATAKRAEGVAFEVRLDRGAASVSEMINVDLKVGVGVNGGGWGWVGWGGGGVCVWGGGGHYELFANWTHVFAAAAAALSRVVPSKRFLYRRTSRRLIYNSVKPICLRCPVDTPGPAWRSARSASPTSAETA